MNQIKKMKFHEKKNDGGTSGKGVVKPSTDKMKEFQQDPIDKKYSCPKCDFRTLYSGGMQSHYRSHTGIFKQCDELNCSFRTGERSERALVVSC